VTVDFSNKIKAKGKQLFTKSRSILFTKEYTSQGTVSESSPTQTGCVTQRLFKKNKIKNQPDRDKDTRNVYRRWKFRAIQIH